MILYKTPKYKFYIPESGYKITLSRQSQAGHKNVTISTAGRVVEILKKPVIIFIIIIFIIRIAGM